MLVFVLETHANATESSPNSGLERREPTKRLLTRTLSRGRWNEYRDLLDDARRSSYEIVSLERWLRQPERWAGRRVMLLRHDVDQHPRSALRMADIERDAGVLSTWYFRWRTADAEIIAELRRRGHAVGLHYETLSRQVRERGDVPEREIARMIPGARDTLRGEIAAFAARHGAITTICPHGDSRVPDVRNADLLLDEDPRGFGVEDDAHLAMRRFTLGAWMTDRSVAAGGWKPGIDPQAEFSRGSSPLLCLVHPNNWVSGPGLWTDRVLAAILPDHGHDPATRPLIVRTGRDRPPI